MTTPNLDPVALRRPLFDYLVERLNLDPKPDLDHYRRTLLQVPRTTLLRWFFSVTDMPDNYITAMLARDLGLPVLPDNKLVLYPDAASYYARFISAQDLQGGWIPLLTYGPFLYLGHYDPKEPIPEGLPPLVGQILLTSAGYENLQTQWLQIKRNLKVDQALSPDVTYAMANPPQTATDLSAQVWLRALGLPDDADSVRLLVEAIKSRTIRFPLKQLDLEYLDTGVSRESLRNRRAYPFLKFEGLIFVAVENPDDEALVESLRMKMSAEIICVPTDASTIDELWDRLLDRERQSYDRKKFVSVGDVSPKLLSGQVVEEDIAELLNKILYKASEARTSDIHLEPCQEGTSIRVRLRRDGMLYATDQFSLLVGRALFTKIKVAANLNITDNRIPQDGRMRVLIGQKQIDVRVALCPLGEDKERIVMRLLDSSGAPDSLEALNFPPDDLERIKRALDMNVGLILVSGPTGSGKTSTLYAALKRLNTPDVSIATVEDPVEYRMEGLNQHEVRAETGLTFPAVLRSLLRMDPDYILVGEIRDSETAATALRAANTGHLVLSTVHANDAISCLTRLTDMGLPPFLVAESGRLFMAQRLVRRLCRLCRMPRPISANEKAILSQNGYMSDQLPDSVYSPKGCPTCYYTGYQKRFAVIETLEMTNALRDAFVRGASRSELFDVARRSGFRGMYVSALGRVLLGDTSMEEIFALQSFD